MSDYILGIDLGTTNSCVAVYQRGDVKVLPNDEGGLITPSVVSFMPSGEVLIGEKALRQAVANPYNTFYGIKRLIGRKSDSPEVDSFRKMASFEIVGAENNDAWVMVNEQATSPQEIASYILSYLKKCAEKSLGCEIMKAVITVPAHFDDSQRQATKDAGIIAGLDVLRLINEPTAAAMAYGHLTKKDIEGKIAVYDLGGGTFDISLLEISGGVFQVKATAGDTYLGGNDFDQQILNDVMTAFNKEYGDLDLPTEVLIKIVEGVEKAKKNLSNMDMADVSCPFVANTDEGPIHLNHMLSRTNYEALVEELILKTLEPCKKVLLDSSIDPGDIHQVLMVGGMTRTPRIQSEVEQFFARPLNKLMNPDQAVAVGAAVQGGVLSGEKSDTLLLDVCPLSIGIETAGEVFTKLIPRNTTIPTRKNQVFSTARDNQDFVRVHVLQGELEMAENNTSLAVFELHGIPPAPRGIPQIEVILMIDANGILTVSAKDLGTGQEKEVKVNPSSGLSDDQVKIALSRAEELRDKDQESARMAQIKQEAFELLYTAKSSLEFFKQALDDEKLKVLAESIAKTEASLEKGDPSELKGNYEQLKSLVHAATQKLYSS